MSSFKGQNQPLDILNVMKDHFVTSRLILQNREFSSQEPLGNGYANAVTVLFGPALTTSDGSLHVGADGVTTVLEAGHQTIVELRFRYGRSSTNNEAKLLIWQEISLDGGTVWFQPVGSPAVALTIDNMEIGARVAGTGFIPASFPVGTKIRIRLARGDASAADGGLEPFLMAGSSFASALEDIPSAEVLYSRLRAV